MHNISPHGRIRHDSNTLKISTGPARFRQYSMPRSMHQTGFKNKAGRTLYIKERIILDMQNKDIQLSDITNEKEERGSAGPEKGPLRDNSKKGIARRQKKSPTLKGPGKLKRRLPTLPLVRSTIGVTKLNFSVRNGKRWNLRAIVT